MKVIGFSALILSVTLGLNHFHLVCEFLLVVYRGRQLVPSGISFDNFHNNAGMVIMLKILSIFLSHASTDAKCFHDAP